MFPEQINTLAQEIIEKANKKGTTISTAESCTGGLIIAALTEISGSSAVVDRGFITYTNQAKMDMVNVEESTLAKHGAVSEETVIEMAEGARKTSGSSIAVAVSGVAGPTGGSAQKPVGLVHYAISSAKGTQTFQQIFKGNREDVRLQTVQAVLKLIRQTL